LVSETIREMQIKIILKYTTHPGEWLNMKVLLGIKIWHKMINGCLRGDWGPLQSVMVEIICISAGVAVTWCIHLLKLIKFLRSGGVFLKSQLPWRLRQEGYLRPGVQGPFGRQKETCFKNQKTQTVDIKWVCFTLYKLCFNKLTSKAKQLNLKTTF
jgi:hypothetical protein